MLGGDAGGAGSEDCLKVNVYAPAGRRQQRVAKGQAPAQCYLLGRLETNVMLTKKIILNSFLLIVS